MIIFWPNGNSEKRQLMISTMLTHLRKREKKEKRLESEQEITNDTPGLVNKEHKTRK